jgi:hypothetical protein
MPELPVQLLQLFNYELNPRFAVLLGFGRLCRKDTPVSPGLFPSETPEETGV